MLLADFLLSMRNQLTSKNIDGDLQWTLIYETTLGKLYQTYFNYKYNHFWTLENPQDIANHRLTNAATRESATLGEIANAFASAYSITDITSTNTQFLSEFDRFFKAKAQVEIPVTYSYPH
ncbi:hypothetical protein BN59_02078 [Legionella massiliensis]|uniref:Uncharacterized protein n=1 Tax=Legionella massiliensis TaxID=1034943 RepID=A0A078L142_9GAMM|nr:hypothetical protein [Legionella massiliensis]CDZ77788.1 hypothetical protein BN59_02078 [Legionella massiliensis]CEE13526.1 hypothetical protein BN1094_02078 [Legionella massiliensis]